MEPDWVVLATVTEDGVVYDLVAMKNDAEGVEAGGGTLWGPPKIRLTIEETE
jgi:hypothetical protein